MYIPESKATPCQVFDAELWFSKDGTRKTARAKQLCFSCPEKHACLGSTLRIERRIGGAQPGTFGGLTESERAEIYRKDKPTDLAG